MADPATGSPLDPPGGLKDRAGYVGGFAADGKTLVTFAVDVVSMWDWPAGTLRAKVTLSAGRESDGGVVSVGSVALSRDGRLLFTNSVRSKPEPRGGTWHNANDVWDARTGKHLHRLEKPEPAYPPGGFSPDGRVIYLGGHSYDPADGKRTRADALTAWDPAAGKVLRRIAEPEPGQREDNPHRKDFGRHIKTLAVSPDGRLLAVAEEIILFDGVWVYETASGRPLKRFTGHARPACDLAFTPDGGRLVSVGHDQTGLVWDVTLPALAALGGKPTEKGLADAWDHLAGLDPGPAYAGIAALTADPANAIALLRRRLQPAPVPTEADLDRVTARLAANKFADREQASADLERFGPNAVAGARNRLATNSAEATERLRRFLAAYDGPHPSPYELRCVRGVAVLEAIGTPPAKALLAELARGDDALAREAATALTRSDR
jgi:hypothetical protein